MGSLQRMNTIPRLLFVSSLLAAFIFFVTLFFHLHTAIKIPTSGLLPSTWKLSHDSDRPVWLIATMTPAMAQERRDIIRSTWQNFYKNPRYETKFVVSNAGDEWDEIVGKENETYGDMIRLGVCHAASE